MSATLKNLYGSWTNIVCSIDGLTSSTTVGRASTVVDNSSNLYTDAQISGFLKTAAGSIGSSPVVYVYGYAALDGTPHYTESVTGSDAGFTRSDPTNLTLLAVINIVASATDYYWGVKSVAAGFGGTLPQKWGLVIVNTSGVALTGTVGQNVTCLTEYQGINVQSV